MKCIPARIAAAIGALASAPACSSHTTSASVRPLSIRRRPHHRTSAQKLQSLFLVSAVSMAAVLPVPAAAYSSFDGYLSNLKYTLTDLDAADGFAPSINFNVSVAEFFTGGLLDGQVADSGALTSAPGSQIMKANLDQFNNFRSAIFFQGLPISNGEPLVMSVAGASNVLTNGGLPDSSGGIRAQSSAGNDFSLAFTLSARTTVKFTMDYWMEVRASIDPADGFMDLASVSATVYANAPNNSDEAGAAFASSNFDGGNGNLSVTASNYTVSSEAGYFYASMRGEAFDYGLPQAAMVPEPETYALMLAGLAAIGLMARRRT